MTGAVPRKRLHLALALLSITVVAFQLVLMQILSTTQWHHFAYLIISIALLGFGAAGTVLALFRTWLLQRLAAALPLLMLGSAVATATVVPLTRSLVGGFDTYLLFVDPLHFGRLLAISLCYAVPFFLAALAIGLVFVRWTSRIGSLYFANLIGSGLGGLAALILLETLPPRQLPAAAALFALAAAFLVLPHRSFFWLTSALTAAAVVFGYLTAPPALPLSQYKDLDGALRLPDARVVARRNSALGGVVTVRSEALRPAADLSLTYRGIVPRRDMAFVNGNAAGPVPLAPDSVPPFPYHQTPSELPYALGDRDEVLILGAATGEAVAHAVTHRPTRIVAVEPHRDLTGLLREAYPETAARVLGHRGVELSALSPRSFLATDDRSYDLIVLPELGTFGGIGGLFAVQEEPLLTREGVLALWQHLRPDGLICLRVWLDEPPRAVPRLTATLVEVLEKAGVADPRGHIAAVRNWSAVTLAIKRSSLTPADTARVRALCRRLDLDPLLLPDLRPGEREHYHQLQDDTLFDLLDALFTAERRRLYRDNPFRLRPATDERPYFSQFLRPAALPRLSGEFGLRNLPFVEMGTLVVIAALVQMSLAGIVLILLPLTRLGWRQGGRLATFLYFGGLGCGYMLVEMVLIHRFTLYLGHPVYAAATVIGAILVFSGCGSYASARTGDQPTAPALAAAVVALAILLYLFLLPSLLSSSMALPLAGRFQLTLLLLAPPSFAMGFPFPLGLRALSSRREEDVPWAWGINGCLSVIATALATIIAVEAGFSAVLLLAAGAYATAAVASLRLFRIEF